MTKVFIMSDKNRWRYLFQKRGMLSVEAAVMMPLLIIVVCSLIYIMRFTMLYHTVQTAMCRSVATMSDYALIAERLSPKDKFGEDYDGSILAYMTALSSVLDLQQTVDDREDHECNEWHNPDLFVEAMADIQKQVLLDSMFRGIMAGHVTRHTQQKSIRVVDEWFLKIIRYAVFSFDVVQNDTLLKITMRYDIQPMIVFGERFKRQAVHIAYMPLWQRYPNHSQKEQKKDSIWLSMSAIARGNHIIRKEQALIEYDKGDRAVFCNTQGMKAGIYQEGTHVFHTVYNIRSLDFHASSYQNVSNLAREVLRSVEAVAHFVEYAQNEPEKVLKADEHTRRILILVLPEGERSDELEKVLNQKVEKATLMGVTLTIKQAYGPSIRMEKEGET